MPVPSFWVIRSESADIAPVRLQSEPLLRGLGAKGIPVRLVNPALPVTVPDDVHLVFHFSDTAARRLIEGLGKGNPSRFIVCLCSDIYDFRFYSELESFVTFFLVPTELHRKVLMCQLQLPVIVLNECVDPMVAAGACAPGSFPVKHGKRAVWFGYAESFYKGMYSLVPVLQRSLENGWLECFKAVLNEEEFDNRFAIPTLPFSRDTFPSLAGEFDYCILSHFPLDLALNSYIKSPNKLVTALMCGLVPLCSATPSYEQLLREFGLSRFLFGSPSEFEDLIKRLDPEADSDAVQKSKIVDVLTQRFSHERIGSDFLNIVKTFSDSPRRELPARWSGYSYPMPGKRQQISFTTHVRDLLPSLGRAISSRLRRAAGKPAVQ